MENQLAPVKHKGYRKVTQLQAVYSFLKQRPATATEVAQALNIYRPNLCRLKRSLEKNGSLAVIRKVRCSITKQWAQLITTDETKFPVPKQLNLF